MNAPRLFFILGLMVTGATWAQADPFLWLEDIEGERALDWVREQNRHSAEALEAEPQFQQTFNRLRAIYDSDARIPEVEQLGAWLYNFWRDAEHPRGIWRRIRPEYFARNQPRWQTVLDLDVLAEQESENWVWEGQHCLHPEYRRCLIKLSRGGADAHVLREFDLHTGQFVDQGFNFPEGKHMVQWQDADTLLLATDTGAESLSESGYPRELRLVRRAQAPADAPLLFSAERSDVGVGAAVYHSETGQRQLIQRVIRFFEYEYFLRSEDHLARLPVPANADLDLLQDRLLIQLRSDWHILGHRYSAGSLLSLPLVAFIEGRRDFEILFEPSAEVTLDRFHTTRSGVLLNLLDQVRGRVVALQLRDYRWIRSTLPVPEFGEARARPLNPAQSDRFHVAVENFLQPTQLLGGVLGSDRLEALRALPAQFDASDLSISQQYAVSADGTRVPYFLVAGRDLKRDGSTPTLLYGYGGFEIALTPGYYAAAGAAWLERGGAFAIANIRGGGEFGPKWHQAAVREHRPRAYEDFAAVATELVKQGITSPQRLGIQGGSNGGLLVGVQLTQYPELYGAVVCQVPLLDMRRYHQLLAGASWMSEYGDPDDPRQWAWISTYSPYQNAQATPRYPPALITTSTRDDRVHPGHARKMAARLMALGQPVLYYENIEGGHGGAANNRQRAYMGALAYSFLWSRLAAPEQTQRSAPDRLTSATR